LTLLANPPKRAFHSTLRCVRQAVAIRAPSGLLFQARPVDVGVFSDEMGLRHEPSLWSMEK